MKHRNLIQLLDNKPNYERLEIIIQELDKLGIGYSNQKYSSGTNLIVDLGNAEKRIGISSHFDKVQTSAGANDNGSAIAVCLDIIKKHKNLGNDDLGLRVFFFDEEENGLQGSTAYVKEHGTNDLIGLINMELVGLGDKFALWPVTERANSHLLSSFESTSKQKQIISKRFDQIVTNTADHLPFQKAGLQDSFTITCISDKDIQVAQKYFEALELEEDKHVLFEILSSAPIFQHYHKPSDTFDKLNEETMQMTTEVIWECLLLANNHTTK
ncbi:MAG TPA: M28 family peptidase [Cyclobacteriaceae bacterium]|nr:Zn-dependent exopeptidase M28 [Cyclobacteriaceae bacterium]HMV07496.1 M28 family peptidase [Cyclobacteriaceae bacterium]HMW99149.1 M28 family peptidase [Cyclobacteriaceae bacterium]HMX48218.1 M28 family peptidase [Cyclobacteriaceae bacterium]HMY95023.1 M28 family peptidase [Cyclobacteriaceae bacterium]